MSAAHGNIALIRGFELGVFMTTIDSRTGKSIKELSNLGGCKKFVNDIPKLFKKNFKAVILCVFTFDPPNYANNYEFRKAIKAKLDQIKMPHTFVCDYQFLCASILTFSNVVVKIGETVIIALVNTRGLQVMYLKYTKNGYAAAGTTQYFGYNPSESHESIRQRIVGTSTPKKILISPNAPGYPIMRHIKQILKADDFFITVDDLIPYDGKCTAEMAKHVFDESYTKFWVIPQAAFGYCIRLSTGSKEYDLLYHLGGEQLPVKKEVTIAKQGFNFTFLARNPQFKREEPIETFKLPTNCHQVELVLSIDANNFPSYQAVPKLLPKVELLPAVLARHVSSKVPVIGIFQNSSVICYHKKDHYEFLDAWNGVYGKELLISFASKKPTFMEAAVEDLRTKPSFVVLDLFRIAAMPIDKIKHNGPWNFTFFKDADHPLLIEFDKVDGTRGAASPAFLMAMLLKEHLKAIKDEIGEKPTDIVFCLLDDHYTAEEQSRITEQFEEACKLLKIEMSVLFYFLLAR